MKHTKFAVIPFFFLCFGCSQSENTVDVDKDKTENRQELKATDSTIILKGSFTETDAISFGRTYNFQINRLIQGSLIEKSIRILVLAGDEYDLFFSTHSSEDDVEITFTKDAENVPYQLMPLTGFVDENMTSWKIRKVRTKQEMITLNITAEEGLQVGYGTLFNCKVQYSRAGDFVQDSILLMLMKSEYIEYVKNHVNPPATFKINCKKIKENVNEKYLPINGFVDNDKNAWEIISIK